MFPPSKDITHHAGIENIRTFKQHSCFTYCQLQQPCLVSIQSNPSEKQREQCDIMSLLSGFFFLMRSLIERSLLPVALLRTDTCCFSVAVYRFSDRKPKTLSLSSGFFTSAFENEPQFKISPPTALLAFTLSTLFVYRNLTSQKGHQVLRLYYFVKKYQ